MITVRAVKATPTHKPGNAFHALEPTNHNSFVPARSAAKGKWPVRIFWVVILTITMMGCGQQEAIKTSGAHCGHDLSMDKIINIVETNLKIERASYSLDITSHGCEYDVFVFPKAGPPDSHVFLILNRKGEVVDRMFGG